MARLGPIHWKKMHCVLIAAGCQFVRQEGDHRVYWRGDLIRPVIVRTKKDIPVFEIKSNLRTLGMSTEEFLRILEGI